jgi:hypothetical protein
VIIVMVLVMVMVMVVVLKALSQVGWVRQHWYPNINRLKHSTRQRFYTVRVWIGQIFPKNRDSYRSLSLSSVALIQVLTLFLNQAFNPTHDQVFKQAQNQLCEMLSMTVKIIQRIGSELWLTCRPLGVNTLIVPTLNIYEQTMDCNRL